MFVIASLLLWPHGLEQSKKIIIKKGGYKIEASNLTDEELFKLFSEAKEEIEIKKE